MIVIESFTQSLCFLYRKKHRLLVYVSFKYVASKQRRLNYFLFHPFILYLLTDNFKYLTSGEIIVIKYFDILIRIQVFCPFDIVLWNLFFPDACILIVICLLCFDLPQSETNSNILSVVKIACIPLCISKTQLLFPLIYYQKFWLLTMTSYCTQNCKERVLYLFDFMLLALRIDAKKQNFCVI